MAARSGSDGFGSIRSTLLKQSPAQLVRLIGDLYRLSTENQRFVRARLGTGAPQLPAYRQFVSHCLYPNVFGKNSEVRIAEARRAISQFARANGDAAGI